jgi:hypothetical protein
MILSKVDLAGPRVQEMRPFQAAHDRALDPGQVERDLIHWSSLLRKKRVYILPSPNTRPNFLKAKKGRTTKHRYPYRGDKWSGCCALFDEPVEPSAHARGNRGEMDKIAAA